MSSFNKVVLVGRLTRDPELRYTGSGKPVASMSIAVNRGFGKPQAGQPEADFFNITAWDKLAETCQKYMNKGRLVLVEGRLQNRSYTATDGSQKTATEIIAQDIRMLGPRSEGGRPGIEDIPHPAEAAPVGAAAGGGAKMNYGASKQEPDYMDDMGMDDIPF